MNNTDSVPARIVIVGTSKLRLSERFNRIQTVQPQLKQHAITANKQEILSVNGSEPAIERPRVFQRPLARGANLEKSFLHDDYMDNQLYGESSIHVPLLNHLRNNHAFSAEYNDMDPIKLSLDDYDNYQRIKPRRPFSRYYNKYAMYDDGGYHYDFYNSPQFRKPIQQRLSFKPRRPIRNTTIFKKPYRGRFGGLRRSNNWHGGARSGRGQMMMKSNNWNGKRLKKTVEELDRELDEYMKSSKHPRVQPAT